MRFVSTGRRQRVAGLAVGWAVAPVLVCMLLLSGCSSAHRQTSGRSGDGYAKAAHSGLVGKDHRSRIRASPIGP